MFNRGVLYDVTNLLGSHQSLGVGYDGEVGWWSLQRTKQLLHVSMKV